MHFISINVLLAQDQKDGGNLNFLMKVISYSFIPILRVIRLCTIREWTWELSLWREMSHTREEERNFKLASKSVSLGISRSKPTLMIHGDFLFCTPSLTCHVKLAATPCFPSWGGTYRRLGNIQYNRWIEEFNWNYEFSYANIMISGRNGDSRDRRHYVFQLSVLPFVPFLWISSNQRSMSVVTC